MTRFARILTIVATLALGLSPLAPVAAQCAGQDQEVMAAMPDMPCCPDDDAQAVPMACKIGCVQLPGLITMPVAQAASEYPATYEVAMMPGHADWLAPVDPDPPRPPLLI